MPHLGQDIAAKPLSILIVDGDDKARYDLAEQLRQLFFGLVVHHAVNGRTALEFLHSHVVHCVVLELDLQHWSRTAHAHRPVTSP
jgi:CheY-like chemotaxis protein